MATAPPYRDLLGDLCAEIERQQAQIGEQGDQIEELMQENERLRLELDDVRVGLGDSCILQPGADEPLTAHGAESKSWCSVGCQTVCLEDAASLQKASSKLQTPCCCGNGEAEEGRKEAANGTHKLQQPEPAPEPLAPASSSAQASLALQTDEVDMELDVLRGALERQTAELNDALLVETQRLQRLEKALEDTQTSEVEPNNSLESEAPAWTLSPTSIGSDASSPLWLGLCTGSLPSSPSHTGGAAAAAALGGLPAAAREEGQPGPHGARGLRRQPGNSTWPLHRTAPASAACSTAAPAAAPADASAAPAPSAALAAAEASAEASAGACTEGGGGDLVVAAARASPGDTVRPGDVRRLVRSVLDALDAAQRRLQQSSRRRGARRAAAAAGVPPCAQVDIRIYVPGCAASEEPPCLTEDGSEAKGEVELGAVTGSFMYILV